MPIQPPNLDDLRFQSDLVDEARKRIINYCPEWTDYNLSDPGITLIELFAWMTEMMIYRFNRVPEINYIKFLDMLGFSQMPASSAATDLSFYLSVDLPIAPDDDLKVVIPEGFEVRSDQTDEELVFTTSQDLTIVHPILSHLRKEGQFNKNFQPRLGIEIFRPFDEKSPQIGDTFYLGFDTRNNLRGHTIRLDFENAPTEAVGIRRDDPPWVWECMVADGKWVEIRPSRLPDETDTTGGLNNPTGSITFYLPLELEPGELYGISAQWLRCRIEQRRPLQGMFDESPRVRMMQVFTTGATIPASHSVNVLEEYVGSSTGEPGQTFNLQYAPVLDLEPGEHILVEETRNGVDVLVPWEYVTEFSASTQFDRHFSMDMSNGIVMFGPAIRQPNGSVIQYGRIPESGREIRFSRYRHGGGVRGNLPPGSLTTLSMSIAYLSRVSNLTRTDGGRDQESLDEVKFRARRELQAQRRAVTAQDYEQFALKYSREIARAACLTPNESQGAQAGTVSVLVVPSVSNSVMEGDLSKLHLEDDLRHNLRQYLDQYRLMTTILNVREPEYYGVRVRVKVVPLEFTNRVEVAERINYELNRYLTPLALDERLPLVSHSDSWDGWSFGRDLFIGEVMSLVQQIPTVKYVMDLELYTRRVVPVEENNMFDDQPKPVARVDRVLRVPPDGLICALDHEIIVVEADEK